MLSKLFNKSKEMSEAKKCIEELNKLKEETLPSPPKPQGGYGQKLANSFIQQMGNNAYQQGFLSAVQNQKKEEPEPEPEPNFLQENFDPLAELIYRTLDDSVKKTEFRDGMIREKLEKAIENGFNNLRKDLIISFAKIMSQLYQGTLDDKTTTDSGSD
jgi:hypothetical protein